MAKIVLDVKDENIQTLLTILENLKEGLINNIEYDDLHKKSNQPRYEPPSNKVVYENERPSGKYISAAAYKAKMKKNQ